MSLSRFYRYIFGGFSIILFFHTGGFLAPPLLQAAMVTPGVQQHYPNPGYVAPQNPKSQYHGPTHRNDNASPWTPDYRVMVYIRMKTINHGSLNVLRAAGVNITHVSEQYKVVTGFVDSDRVVRLRHLKPVLHVELAKRPMLNPNPLKPLPGNGGINGPITGPFHK